MHSSCALRFAFLLSLLLLPNSARAQSAAAPTGALTERPRVGVALAGGSALGLAHVGVLRWMVEHRVPIDAVAGTSMGGLVGGMYAAGFEPDEITEFIHRTNWGRIFGPNPPYSQLLVRRKEDRMAFPNELDLGLRGGLRAPAGINPGVEVTLLLDRFAAPYGELGSFDDLPTPFRCVATDLVSGHRVVFDRGSFGQALRATMSIPGVFAPVRRDGQVLVDGGILDNLPVDVVKQMNVSVVVAIALETPPADQATLDAFLGVARQSLSVMISQNESRNLRAADLVVAPELQGIDASDFENSVELERRGYAAAEAKARFLETLALPTEAWRAYQEERQQKRRALATPQFIAVNGAGHDTGRAQRLLAPLVNEPANTRDVEQRINRVLGDDRYAAASYEQVERDGQTGYEVDFAGKRHGPPYLNLGVDLDGSKITDMRFDITGRVTWDDLGLEGAEWRNTMALGLDNLLASEYYIRLGSGFWFVAPRAFTESTRHDFYEGNIAAAQYAYRQQGGGLDFGIAPGHDDEFRVGYQFTHLSTVDAAGPPPLQSVAANLNYLRGRWYHDTTNDPAIPTHGVRSIIEMGWEFTSSFGGGYPRLEGSLVAAQPIGSGDVLLGTMSGGSTFNRVTPYSVFFLGGPLHLSALGLDQLSGNNYYNATANYLHRLSFDPVAFFRRSYLGFAVEAGKAFDNPAQARPFYDASLGLYGVTRLGVVFVGGSLGDSGERKLFVQVGRAF